MVSTIIPVIAMTGGFLNKFVSSYRTRSLSETSKAGTLAEEVISSVRNAHAFSTQQKLVAMYDKPNAEAQNLGGRSAIANSAASERLLDVWRAADKRNKQGLGVIFFVIYVRHIYARRSALLTTRDIVRLRTGVLLRHDADFARSRRCRPSHQCLLF